MVATRLGQIWQMAKATGQKAWPGGRPFRSAPGKTTIAGRRGSAKFFTLAVLMGMFLWGLGCTTSWFANDRIGVPGDQSGSWIRPTTTETSRLLKNAHYYKLMGRPEAALKELEQAHRLDADNLKIVDILAQIYQDLGQFQRAQELYQEVLARHSSNRPLYNNLCFSFYLQGNLAKAESCFQEALTRDPGNTAARNNLGLLWCRQGKLAEAQKLWQETEGAEVAQNRVAQTLAFLGMSLPANYAKAEEPKPATSQKPAVKPSLAPPAKSKAAKAAPPALPPAASPKSELKEIAKPGQPELTAPRAQMKETTKPVLPPQPAAPVNYNTTAKTEPAKAPPLATKAPPAAEQKQAARPAISPDVLTATEIAGAGIEIRNGTHTRNLARNTGNRLSREGFKVIQVGNHIDFGAEATVIFYRPGKENVARALTAKIFPEAGLEQSSTLKNGVAVKVLLGRDLSDRSRTMARSAGKEMKMSPSPGDVETLEQGPRRTASKKPIAHVRLAKADPGKPKIRETPPAAGRNAKGQTFSETATPAGSMNTEELGSTAIDIPKGALGLNLGDQPRGLLSGEGFNGGIVGKPIDSEAEPTIISYRPGVEQLAQALTKIFTEAK